ncbi:MAG TPA: conserved virulence factor C family protein [Bacillota bacterium]|nr:conserved virulence factor C family protein [Bacillota bacterium]
MKITSIEPTPSPHSMKINVSERLPDGETLNYKSTDDLTDAPNYIQQLFTIKGIINIYRVVDFITIARQPRTPWEKILPEVRKVLGTVESEKTLEFSPKTESDEDTSFGAIQVFFQMFRGIPLQVKLHDGQEERRVGLPKVFTEAAMEAAPSSPNIIMEREWVEQGVRYGTFEDVSEIVVEELAASYDEDRLKKLVKLAFQADGEQKRRELMSEKVTLEMLDDPDWRNRYAALDRMDPTIDDLAVLDKALDDERSSVRRLATAYLGMIDDKKVLPYLYKALKDSAANVRRTAGDCLSDLGFIEAMPEMIKTLKDDNRIVRWRAAMFLYEIGDETAIPALEAAKDDPEFEVRLQINMALERIKGGHAAKGSIWQQMTEATSGRKRTDH